jgi:hypothetical protein
MANLIYYNRVEKKPVQGYCFIILCILILIICYNSYIDTKDHINGAAIFAGKVVGFTSQCSSSCSHNATISYRDENHHIQKFNTSTGPTMFSRYEINDTVKVLSNPQKKPKERVDSFSDLWQMNTIFILAAFFFAIYGIRDINGVNSSTGAQRAGLFVMVGIIGAIFWLFRFN